MSKLIEAGAFNMILGGQFGSEGKGKVAAYIAENYKIDIVATNTRANSGHTFYMNGVKHHTTHIPVAGIVNPKTTIYFTHGSVIDVDILFKEMDRFDIDDTRVHIHPNATIITPLCKEREKELGMKYGSTFSGTGAALANKLLRTQMIACENDILKEEELIHRLDLNMLIAVENATVLMETGQGFELSLNGNRYPYCTSRDVNVTSTLSDANVQPHHLGKVNVCIRSFPIRSGNKYDENGKCIMNTAPEHFSIMREIDWEDIGVTPEISTITKTVRRVFTFGYLQYSRMVRTLNPDNVILSFMDYVPRSKWDTYIRKIERSIDIDHEGILCPNCKGITWLSYGPESKHMHTKESIL